MTASVPDIRVTVMPPDTNPYGGAFGGWIISQMALGAASLASRHSKGRAILVAAADMNFPAGAVAGDELSAFATLERTGRSSMIIHVRADRRDRDSDTIATVGTGRFTFVAVDEANRPRQITPDQEQG